MKQVGGRTADQEGPDARGTHREAPEPLDGELATAWAKRARVVLFGAQLAPGIRWSERRMGWEAVATRELGEHANACSYFFSFAGDAEALCDCARRHDPDGPDVPRFFGAPRRPRRWSSAPFSGERLIQILTAAGYLGLEQARAVLRPGGCAS